MSERGETAGGHLSEEDIELYVLGRMEDNRLEYVEEHLLVCERCQQKVEEEEDFVRTLRAALRAEEAGGRFRRKSAFWRGRGIWAAALTMAAALLAVMWLPRMAGPAVQVELVAVRSGELAEAPSHRTLELHADRRGLPSHPRYRAEIVDSQGRIVDQSSAPAGAATVSWRVKGLPPGVYLVRFLGPQGELLREFALRVR